MTSLRGFVAIVLGLAAVAAFRPLSAQWPPPPLRSGQRVRVTAPSAGLDRSVGTIRAVRGREFVLWPERFDPRADTAYSLSLDSVRSLEVSMGRHSHFWAGAGIGAAIGGLGLGLVAGVAAATCRGFCVVDPGAAGMTGLVVGGLLGGLLGGIVGAAVVTERWWNVPLERLRVGMTPLPAGHVGLGASLAL